jgi:glucose-6-phosphate isomerase
VPTAVPDRVIFVVTARHRLGDAEIGDYRLAVVQHDVLGRYSVHDLLTVRVVRRH